MEALRSNELEQPLCPGAILADEYQVLDYLGSGDASDVYACRRLDAPERILAARVVGPIALSSTILSSRVWNDMQFGYLLNDPNVVRYFGHRIDDTMLVAVREFFDGGTLAGIIERETLGICEILSVLSRVLTGLSGIHAARVVHCDLGPQNVLVSRDLSAVKIKGFSFAHVETSPLPWPVASPPACAIARTPEYRAERHVDRSGDIYSFGALAYELICRSKPSETKYIEPPRSLRHDCPKRLSELVLRCLSEDPKERPVSVDRVRRDLEAVVRSLTLSAIPAFS